MRSGCADQRMSQEERQSLMHAVEKISLIPHHQRHRIETAQMNRYVRGVLGEGASDGHGLNRQSPRRQTSAAKIHDFVMDER